MTPQDSSKSIALIKREFTIYFRGDQATGDEITHFRMSNDNDWIPAPAWNSLSRQPEITLSDVERWNQAPVIARYTLLLLRLYYRNLHLMMSQKRRDKLKDGVEITRYTRGTKTYEGWFRVETNHNDEALSQLLFKFYEPHKMKIIDAQTEVQLELFGRPLILDPTR